MMKSFLISDNRDTYVAMRLAGINGVLVHEREEILEAMKLALDDSSIGILILTELILEKVEKEVMSLKLHRKYPLIVEIPDRHGQRRDANYITKHINESVGIKI